MSRAVLALAFLLGAASCAVEPAFVNATNAAIASPASSHDPAACAAGAHTANTPAPIIAARPIATASRSPSRRARRSCAGDGEEALTLAPYGRTVNGVVRRASGCRIRS